ncbi:MAG: SLOG family protein [Eubacteriales bacterium]
MVCGFTGHRPQRLPWGFDEADPRCVALKTRIAQEVASLATAGVTTFVCGMALGCDFYFAEAVLRLGESRPDIRLIGALPCPQQHRSWDEDSQGRYIHLCSRCYHLEMVSDHYSPHCMNWRNRWIAEQSDYMLTVFDGGGGGTSNAVGHAQAQGVTVIPLWL